MDEKQKEINYEVGKSLNLIYTLLARQRNGFPPGETTFAILADQILKVAKLTDPHTGT